MSVSDPGSQVFTDEVVNRLNLLIERSGQTSSWLEQLYTWATQIETSDHEKTNLLGRLSDSLGALVPLTQQVHTTVHELANHPTPAAGGPAAPIDMDAIVDAVRQAVSSVGFPPPSAPAFPPPPASPEPIPVNIPLDQIEMIVRQAVTETENRILQELANQPTRTNTPEPSASSGSVKEKAVLERLAASVEARLLELGTMLARLDEHTTEVLTHVTSFDGLNDLAVAAPALTEKMSAVREMVASQQEQLSLLASAVGTHMATVIDQIGEIHRMVADIAANPSSDKVAEKITSVQERIAELHTDMNRVQSDLRGLAPLMSHAEDIAVVASGVRQMAANLNGTKN